MSVKSVQAPSLGINQHDSYDDMKEGYALLLDNWIAEPGKCRLRRGSQTLSNHTDSIETIMSYGDQLILAAGGNLIDADLTYTGGMPTVGTASNIATGFSVNAWDWVSVNNKLLMVNGTDTPQQYDGTTVSAINFTSGLTSASDLIGVSVFKGRAIYWKDEAGFYYAEAGSYQGAMAYFDLSPFVSKKANLKLFFNWSSDAGDGADDFAIFVMDTGEALVYQGTDPSDAANWDMIGVYKMGVPLALRGSAGISGDELVITRLGWQNFGVVWESANMSDRGIGRNVSGLAAAAVDEYGLFSGWECHFYPEYRLVIVQIPTGSGTSIQHVMNTNTFGWSTFSGWNATTFGNFNGQIVYGTSSGDLVIAMMGFDDDGAAILGDSLPAFDYMKSRANNKLLTAVRPLTTLDDPSAYELVGASDFITPSKPVLNVTPPTFNSAEWGDPWGTPWTTRASPRPGGEWRSASGYGYALSFRMSTSAIGRDVFWYSTQLMYDRAGEV